MSQRRDLSPDLSVVVTVHSETCVAGPTMRAAQAAIRAAEAAGYAVERLIAYDNPTQTARAFFDQHALDAWTRINVDGGDVGHTRNAVIREYARGRAVAFLDADDLFSEHWLARGMARLDAAEAAGARAIIHPELNWLFDGAGAVYWNPDQDDPLFIPQYFYVMNYYDSLCLAPRAAYLEHPYVTRDIPRGLSFQDWQFAVETMAGGWRHVAAKGTIIYKRRRDVSLVTESRLRRSILRQLAPLRIDKVAALGGETRPEDPPVEEPPALAASMDALRALNDRARSETPHWGAGFQARIARAEARAPEGADADHAAAARVFDLASYYAAHPDLVAAEHIEPVAHYLRAGHRERRDPSPLIGSAQLRERMEGQGDGAPDPDRPPLLRWLGMDEGDRPPAFPFTYGAEVAALFGMDVRRLERHWAARIVDLRARLMFGDLGAEAAAMAGIEPLVAQGWPEAALAKVPALHSDMFVTRLSAIAAIQAAAGGRPARAVICVNRPRFGGARRMEGQIAQALAARYGAENVLVLSTDKPGAMPEGKFPEGVRHVDMAAILERVRAPIRLRLMAVTLQSLAPEVVFNVNSRLLWETLEPHGAALAASMDLVGCLLCNEQTALGGWTGYPLRRFHRAFDTLSAVATDSAALARELRESFMIPPEEAGRIAVLPAPVRGDIAPPEIRAEIPAEPPEPAPEQIPEQIPEPTRRPQVFWAGRLDPQKRVDLAFEIARAMPEADFRLWGARVSGNPHAWPARPGNLVLEGAYGDFAELPLGEADAWLYTSGWDGVPQILLEVAMAALPVVASDVGGVREAFSPDGKGEAFSPDGKGEADGAGLAFLPPEAGAEAYVAALRAMIASADEAREAALTRRAALAAARTDAAYAAEVDALLDGIAARKEARKEARHA